jgi:hypothetical protein
MTNFSSTVSREPSPRQAVSPITLIGNAPASARLAARVLCFQVNEKELCMGNVLGHAKLEPTQVYAESSTEMLRESYQRALSR